MLDDNPSPIRTVSPRRGGAKQLTVDELEAELERVREDTEWERCSKSPHIARSVRLKNSNERRRLQTLRLSLDRQLEREIRRLNFERNEFVEALERANGRPRTAILRQTTNLESLATGWEHGSSPSALNMLPRSSRFLTRSGGGSGERGLKRPVVLLTTRVPSMSEGCSPSRVYARWAKKTEANSSPDLNRTTVPTLRTFELTYSKQNLLDKRGLVSVVSRPVGIAQYDRHPQNLKLT